MNPDTGSAGIAALSICESMLLSMIDNKVIDARESRAILQDAAEAHRNAIPVGVDVELHRGAVAAIELILDGRNAVRRR